MAADQAVNVVLCLAVIAAGWVFVGYALSRPNGFLQHDKEFGLAVFVGLSFLAGIVSDVMYWLTLPEARGRYSREMDAFDQFVCAAPWAFVSPVFSYVAFRLSSQSFGKVVTGIILALSLLILSEVLIAL